MNGFNDIQNKDDVLFRDIIVGALDSLRDKIHWKNTIDNVSTKVEVPIYYTVSGSERFLSNIFLNSDKLDKEGKITGLYNKYPRAHVSLESLSLQEEYLANKFKRADYLKEEQSGEIRQYNADYIEAPFKMDFNVTIYVDSILDIYKCIESIFRNLYKNVYFYVQTNSIKIPCVFSIPPDITKERLLQFGLSDKKEIKVTFPIELHTSFPIFKEETSIFKGNTIENFVNNTYIVKGTENPNFVGRIDDEEKKDIWPEGNNNTPTPN